MIQRLLLLFRVVKSFVIFVWIQCSVQGVHTASSTTSFLHKLSSINYCILSSFISSRRQQHPTSTFCYRARQREEPPPPPPPPPPPLPQKSVVVLPHVPTLDTSGLLPPSMYYDTTVINSTTISSKGIEHKPTNRIQIAWDVSQPVSSDDDRAMNEITKDDVYGMVSNIQHALDHGLTTFQLKPYTSSSNTNQLQYDIYKTLIDQTPKSILEQQSQIIVPLRIEDVLETTDSTSATKSISIKSVRTHIITLLDRLGSDCLDHVQIQFRDSLGVHDDITYQRERKEEGRTSTKNNHLTSIAGYDSTTTHYNNNFRVDDRYYFDLISEMQELVRDGYIRSISTKDLTSSMYEHIQTNQLHTLFSTNQIDFNLCRVAPLTQGSHPTDQYSNKDSLYIPQHTIAANPLAGGWLVDRYSGPQQQQQHPTLTWFRSLPPMERWNWDRNIVQSWMTLRSTRRATGTISHDVNSIWNIYQTELMKPIRNIARKHGVSSASVVLRWTLQQNEHLQSTGTVPCRQSAACSSTVISCRLLPEHLSWDTHRPYTSVVERVQQIREVLRFTLDEDDIEELWELSSYVEPEQPVSFNENKNYYDDNLDRSSSGLFIPKR